ncbi:hypothetical protein PPERSA_12046 [Pseudocohnilembus persalinus]|uniref:Uncharacterized protein n=1 Tax=Pseudocohnilembus persalinus TaxID=266149 RepID=A0A0V0R9E6_PSEPJ|nr:hypothetical protein PPERSA_12046 [Pseudocohnilembus persalinus]|eukprot:KRX10922.1 hypothetical protein PPERSA_12046 [Pseudocohnilembus persalinus]
MHFFHHKIFSPVYNLTKTCRSLTRKQSILSSQGSENCRVENLQEEITCSSEVKLQDKQTKRVLSFYLPVTELLSSNAVFQQPNNLANQVNSLKNQKYFSKKPK